MALAQGIEPAGELPELPRVDEEDREGDPRLASQAVSRRSYMTTPEVVQRLNRSRAWVKRHALRLGASLVNGVYRFPIADVERFAMMEAEQSPIRPLLKPGPSDGQRASAIFKRLEAGQSLSQIIQELEEPPDFVTKTRNQWRACYEVDRQGLDFRCECGAPSNLKTAHCDRCAPRTRTLTPAQIALLAGEELPPPGSCACSGCGTQHLTENVERLCSECQKNAVGIVVANGRAEIALRLSSGKLLSLRPLSAEEVAAVARLAAPQAPAVVSPPAVTEPDAPVDERAPALRALDAVMKQSAVGLSRLDELLEQERKKSGKP